MEKIKEGSLMDRLNKKGDLDLFNKSYEEIKASPMKSSQSSGTGSKKRKMN